MCFTWPNLFPHILPFQVTLQVIRITDPFVSISSTFWQTADGRRHRWPLTETWQTAGQQPALSFEIEPASFAILQQTILLGLSVWLTGQLMFRASIQLFVILDAAVHWQNQHLTNFLMNLMVQISLLGFWYFHLFTQNVSQHLWKCSWKGMKTFCVTLNNR